MTMTSSSSRSTSSPSPSLSDMSLDNYRFPTHRLRLHDVEPEKTPLVVVACGSFSPPTVAHMGMHEITQLYFKDHSTFALVGQYFSPVSDAYGKAGLAPAADRVKMLEMCSATNSPSNRLLMVDAWEAIQPGYTPTAKVLDHFDHEINEVLGGVVDKEGNKRRVQIKLLAGADLISTMNNPGVWSTEDLAHILGRYGAFVVEREGTEIGDLLQNLREWEDNIQIVPMDHFSKVSSTRVRLMIKKGIDIYHMVPPELVDYIRQHNLFEGGGDDTNNAASDPVQSSK